ncbi:histidine phosphatase family protein [Ktedonobacteria bacterium brp13]|nr:histidine phosphatase family protein [Ktedonobacteria bacterium brp13]
MDLYLVRHGEKASYATDAILTPRGEQQARAVGRYCAQLPVTLMAASPLLRTLKTAQIMSDAMGGQPFEIWPEIREGLFREARRYPKSEGEKLYPSARFTATFDDQPPFYAIDTEESMLARSREAIRLLQARSTADDTVVLVTHGGFISYFMHTILQMTPGSFSYFKVAFASITHLRYYIPEPRKGLPPVYPARTLDVLSVGDTIHLQNLLD